MAIIHAVRSDNSSFNAIFSYGGKTPGIYPPSGANSPTYDVDATAIGGNSFNLDRGAASPRMLFWNSVSIPSTSRAISVLARIKFGANSANYNIFERLGGSSTIHQALLAIGVNSSNVWKVEAENESANAGLSNQSMGTDNVGTSNWIDMVFTWTGDTTTNGANLYIDGVSLATATSTQSMASTFAWKVCNSIVLGSGNFGSSVRFKVNEFVIWDTAIDPTNVALVSGNGSLNGNSRASFVSVSTFDGSTNTGAGATNIRSGSTEVIAGVTITGTAAIPTAANVRSGTATDATTGTLVVPSANDVRNGTSVDAGTGNLVVPLANTVKLNTTYDSNSSVTGTYTAACDYPAVSNVKLNVSYSNGSLIGTYNPLGVGSGGLPAAQLSERTRKLIIALIQANISSELANIRADRNDNTIQTEAPSTESYFIFNGAHTYQTPAIFCVVDSGEVPDERLATNYVSALMKVYVSAVVSSQLESTTTIKAERYQAALFKILHQAIVSDTTDNVKIHILCKRFQFSELYTKSRKADNMANFYKEVALELEVKHWENPTS